MAHQKLKSSSSFTKNEKIRGIGNNFTAAPADFSFSLIFFFFLNAIQPHTQLIPEPGTKKAAPRDGNSVIWEIHAQCKALQLSELAY